ncbi:urea carboxylase-associated family protein [Ideonella azotifigens]|uniref:Urea carboxylase-associated family protein n=1 Tax=Ideonella azotifigens TaxID=513160 RepID=A0ABP3V395_9BURK|nr:urea amidolyase associated protein UAAP2 [Ideonella azotifigens]MCD2343257.1 urea carboxylase-associated family protein [Ideonella azotifigens]
MSQATAFRIQESLLDPADALHDHTVPAGEPCLLSIKAGQTLRLIDLEGNQAIDALFYAQAPLGERYSATNTMLAQGGIYLTTGSVLMSNTGRKMATIVADTCGRHDTLGGACSTESNQVRYALGKRHMHACRDNFLSALLAADIGLGKRDLAPNINFFMNVPVTPEGGLKFDDGVSAPGKYVELRAEIDLWLLISNCPQLNNPCNGYDPTPAQVLVWS